MLFSTVFDKGLDILKIKAHVYSNGKTMENLPVTFDEAMFMVEHQDTFYQDEDNYLGFTSPKDDDAVIQFIREEDDKWLVDVPVVANGIYRGSYMTIANHSKIVAIVTNFFIEESNLRQSIEERDYKKLENEMANRWGLGIHLVESSN